MTCDDPLMRKSTMSPKPKILLLCHVGGNDPGFGSEYTDGTVMSYFFMDPKPLAKAKGLRTLIMLRRLHWR